MRLLLEQQQNRRRILYGAPKTEPSIQRDLAHCLCRHIAQIHGYHAESPGLDEQIHGAQSLIDILATHPQQFVEHDLRCVCR